MRKITMNTFRRVTEAEERMMRSMMPKTSLASPDNLRFRAFDGVPAPRRRPLPVSNPLTYKISEAR